MQRDFSSCPNPNTYRDSNDIQTTQDLVPSASIVSEMATGSDHHHSIVRIVEPERLPSQLFNPSNQNRVRTRPLIKSIVQSSQSDDEQSRPEQQDQLNNESLINHGNSRAEAAGYDPNQITDMDPDEAYALQLQQEEYSRESLMRPRHPYISFPLEQYDDPAGAAAANLPAFYSGDQQIMNDHEYAAYVQEEENRNRQRRRPPLPPFFQQRSRSNPATNQSSEVDDPEGSPDLSFAVNNERQRSYNEDDSDEDNSNNHYMNDPHLFLQALANYNGALPGGLELLRQLDGRGRRRRTGNLQDTEEDFGPEDYERLLQLDDTINKKELTKEQINSIRIERFIRTSNNSDEENKCGVCLEFFEENQELRRFPCVHLYHKECADRWLQENNVCPICREPPIKSQQRNHQHPSRGHIHMGRPTANGHRHSSQRNNNNNNNIHRHPNRKGPSSQRPS